VGLKARQGRADAVQGLLPELVVHPASVPPVGEQARVLQNPEMKGQSRLGGISRLGEVADAPLPVPEQLHDPKPSRVGECVEEPGGLFPDRLGNGSGHAGIISNKLDVSRSQLIHTAGRGVWAGVAHRCWVIGVRYAAATTGSARLGLPAPGPNAHRPDPTDLRLHSLRAHQYVCHSAGVERPGPRNRVCAGAVSQLAQA